jgi:hypothetical protein
MQIHADVKNGCEYWPLMLQAMFTRNPIISEMKSNVAVSMAFAQFSWEANGEQTFLLGADQCRMFKEMDLSSVTADDIRFPYEAFYVAVEGSGMTLRATVDTDEFGEPAHPSKYRAEHSLQGIYAFRGNTLKAGSRTRLGTLKSSIMMCVPEGTHISDLAQENNQEEAWPEDGTTFVAWAHDKDVSVQDDIIFSLFVPDFAVREYGNYEKTVEELLKYAHSLSDNSIPDADKIHNQRHSLEAIRMVIGMCAYLECRQAIVVEKDYKKERDLLQRKVDNGGKKGAKAARMLTKIPSCKIRIIDPTLRYQGEEHVAIKAHWRRAHTRLQWVGTKIDETGNARNGTHRERRWIPATIVNADGGESSGRTYTF